MKTCSQCKYYHNSQCRGHAPTVLSTGVTMWPYVQDTDKACFKFQFDVVEEDTREDTEQLYEYIRIGKRRTMKQIESQFEHWGLTRITNTLNALKTHKLVVSKQQGVAYYWVCVDVEKKYNAQKYDVPFYRELILSLLTDEKPMQAKALNQAINDCTDKRGLTKEYFDALRGLIKDKFVKLTDSDSGHYYTKNTIE